MLYAASLVNAGATTPQPHGPRFLPLGPLLHALSSTLKMRAVVSHLQMMHTLDHNLLISQMFSLNGCVTFKLNGARVCVHLLPAY